MKIIAFPFAGGSTFSYQKIFDDNVITLDYPGRGSKIDEPFATSIENLIAHLLPETLSLIAEHPNYMIYGHSMGALVAYLMTHKIAELSQTLPQKLVVSGHKGPLYKRASKLSTLPENQFWDRLSQLGGIPTTLNEYPELKALFIPILRADFDLLENYEPQSKNKLSIPIDVFYGNQENITAQEIVSWKAESTARVTIEKLNGNHFFIFNNTQFNQECLTAII